MGGEQRKLEIQYFPVLKKFYTYQAVKNTPLPIEPNSTNISSGDIGIKRYLVNYIKKFSRFCRIVSLQACVQGVWRIITPDIPSPADCQERE
ncbi:MAG: hypothetical protein ACFFD2_18100 [Promethearchaeota archaeon]